MDVLTISSYTQWCCLLSLLRLIVHKFAVTGEELYCMHVYLLKQWVGQKYSRLKTDSDNNANGQEMAWGMTWEALQFPGGACPPSPPDLPPPITSILHSEVFTNAVCACCAQASSVIWLRHRRYYTVIRQMLEQVSWEWLADTAKDWDNLIITACVLIIIVRFSNLC